mmetsp:Transcript_47563/g.101760  ORF Transcript_47563/g.101760 Transcript_47563/m.101760 type:complete len:436 (-) Transcript_47563:36-1343(-)
MAELMRDTLSGLDEATLTYLESAVEELREEGDEEGLRELLEPYFEELDPLKLENLLSSLCPTSTQVKKSMDLEVPVAVALGDLLKFREDFDPQNDVEQMGVVNNEAVADDKKSTKKIAKSRSRKCASEGLQDGEEEWPEEELAWRDFEVPSRLEGQPKLPNWAKRLFDGAWREELQPWPRLWTADQVALMSLHLSPKATKVASVLRNNELDGSLCLAGGVKLLSEEFSGLKQAESDLCKAACRRLMDWMKTFDVECRCYRELYSSPSDLDLWRSFRNTEVVPALKLALRPTHPRYLTIEPKVRTVKATDAEIQQRWGSEDAEGTETLRVLCVLENGLVQHNMIYLRNSSSWWLLASVDFAWHGEAGPGHWHLNRTPHGEQIEHWGPRNNVYHGEAWNCPLWWLVIPKGHSYAHRPLRLDLLPVAAFGSIDDDDTT